MKKLLVILLIALTIKAWPSEREPFSCTQRAYCSKPRKSNATTPNRLEILMGYGPTGLSRTVEGNSTKYSLDRSLVYGVSYTKKVHNGSLGTEIFTNGSIFLKVGSDF